MNGVGVRNYVQKRKIFAKIPDYLHRIREVRILRSRFGRGDACPGYRIYRAPDLEITAMAMAYRVAETYHRRRQGKDSASHIPYRADDRSGKGRIDFG